MLYTTRTLDARTEAYRNVEGGKRYQTEKGSRATDIVLPPHDSGSPSEGVSEEVIMPLDGYDECCTNLKMEVATTGRMSPALDTCGVGTVECNADDLPVEHREELKAEPAANDGVNWKGLLTGDTNEKEHKVGYVGVPEVDVSVQAQSLRSIMHQTMQSRGLTEIIILTLLGRKRPHRLNEDLVGDGVTSPSGASSPRQPCSKSPPPLPPRPHTIGSKDKPVSSSETRDAWPELPKLQVPDDRRQPSRAKTTSSVPYKLTDEDKQAVAIISSLPSAIRVLLDKMPSAQSASHVLVAISPVLANLQKTSN
ncbi:hypothetical protein HPB50_001214 [Hyalomma asiaticum]|uniref:Uncharacterized protein n=1 Tax=Hyalomma asiaticum TaxID=266040 RepID=A0ACB7SCS9_HYAAI|nr:hypothetical protein HPB50_001214 [Hyalomma asiaticum]